MGHHKRKRPKHRRSGCLLCKPNKLTAAVKAERRENRRRWLAHEQAGGGFIWVNGERRVING